MYIMTRIASLAFSSFGSSMNTKWVLKNLIGLTYKKLKNLIGLTYKKSIQYLSIYLRTLNMCINKILGRKRLLFCFSLFFFLLFFPNKMNWVASIFIHVLICYTNQNSWVFKIVDWPQNFWWYIYLCILRERERERERELSRYIFFS